MVAPYSGAMLATVQRSAAVRLAAPSPKNSTNLPTTFALRMSSVTVSARSVAVTPSRRRPVRWQPTTSGVRKALGWPSILQMKKCVKINFYEGIFGGEGGQ